MNEYGIRLAKAKLSEIVRAAAQGVCSLVTDNHKPVAMIGPLPGGLADAESPPSPAEMTPRSAARSFRQALFQAPYPLDLDF